MSDIWTMIWKESKEFLFSGGRSNFLQPLLISAILGIVLPLSFTQHWLTLEPAPILIILYTPFLFITSFIGDAIAGERERHTLETLLASRISDRAILFGKLLTAVGFTWGITLFSLLLGAVVINLSQGLEQWVFYAPINLFLVVLVMSFLSILLAASGGVLISLKSATARQAAQMMVLGELILGFAVYGVVSLLPDSVTASLTTSQVVLIIMLVLVILDTILIGASLASFQRSRLILD
ncbi:MAG: ABC transporter permease subunit [Candidatus Promineifilaceae bacterium]